MDLLTLTAYAGIALLVAIVVNIISQLLFHDKTKPPVVFHWIPFLGSTITYGLDPYAFLFSCKEKVSNPLSLSTNTLTTKVWGHIHLHPIGPKNHRLPRHRRQ